MGSAETVVQEVLAVLHELLEQAQNVEAEVGAMPGADEALGSAIDRVEGILTRLRTT